MNDASLPPADLYADLDFAACERARLSRDPRFDGRFFVGVRSTGIYCRPICPVRLPKPENVRFYPSAAAAAAQGFRPCLRCRPELAPGNPHWPLREPLLRAALQRMRSGLAGPQALTELAKDLGISDRHLRRLFEQHIGASPQAVLQHHRLLLAKQLLSDTRLPIYQVAVISGFASAQRLRLACQASYGLSPRELRRERRKAQALSGAEQIKLSYRPPLDWPALRDFLRKRAIAGIEKVENESYERSFVYAGQAGQIRLQHQADQRLFLLQLQHPDPQALSWGASRARCLLDLDCLPDAIEQGLAADPQLSSMLTRHPGLRLPGCWDRFELCVRAILGQQVSVAAATTLCRRLSERCGQRIEAGGDSETSLLFPDARAIDKASLDGLGITGARIRSLKLLAQAILRGDCELERMSAQEAAEALLKIPGIGPWTAAYIMMRGFGEPDVLPAQDIVLRQQLGQSGAPLSAAELERRGEAWRPWRSYAVMQIWNQAAGV